MTSLNGILSVAISVSLILPPHIVWAKRSAEASGKKDSPTQISGGNKSDGMKLSVHKVSPETKKANDAREFLKVSKSIKRNSDVLVLLLVTGASREAIKAIAADLKVMKTDLAKPFKMTIQKDQIFLNGIASDMYVKSYSPLTLKVGTQIWKYEPDRSADQNYFALKKIASGKSSNAMMRLFFPSADAAAGWFGPGWGIVLGGLIGLGGAQFLGWNKWWSFGVTVFGIIGGYFLGKWNQNRVSANSGGYGGGKVDSSSDGAMEVIDAAESARSGITVYCNDNEVTINGYNGDFIRVKTRSTGNQEVIENITSEGVTSCDTVTCEQWPALMERAAKCKNESDAASMRAELINSIPAETAFMQSTQQQGGVD